MPRRGLVGVQSHQMVECRDGFLKMIAVIKQSADTTSLHPKLDGVLPRSDSFERLHLYGPLPVQTQHLQIGSQS